MSVLSLALDRARKVGSIGEAVHRNGAVTKQGVLERLFSFAFSGLVYPQIWEDPVPDLEALELRSDSHLVTIASGGCNVLSYLTADPRTITAVDLNHAHIALNELKLSALCHLPTVDDFRRFFLNANSEANVDIYDRLLAPSLSQSTRACWDTSGWGGRRIQMFSRNIYRFGLLGKWIGIGHIAAKLYGIDLSGFLKCKTLEEQKAYFERHIAPIFDKKLIRFLTGSPISLYGLGIPPAQYQALAEGRAMADVLCERLRRLATGFPLDENYFAWHALKRTYSADHEDGLPLYLQRKHFEALRAGADRIRLRQGSVTDVLRVQPRSSIDAVVLLDAQDWMTPAHLNELWQALSIACKPDARVIFRTAGQASVLPGRIDSTILDRFDYDQATSKAMFAKDRSAVYGGFHLYRLRAHSRSFRVISWRCP
jgi:S-adenosylmethionine-diacylglycerol 3-amino-3-carboxypropyl transferase